MLFEREISDGVETVVIILWRSLESIRGFAVADLEQAVVAEGLRS
jgi:heme-degrading monooxygenase HmoA